MMWKQEGTRRRRNRQSSDIGGILPAEEAAIKRALWESLRTAAAERDNRDSSSDSSRSSSPPAASRRDEKAAKKTKRRRKSIKSTKCNSAPTKSLNSVSEPSGMDVNGRVCINPMHNNSRSSPLSDSSPVISESGSLKLVLSPSSSPVSSSSSIYNSPRQVTSLASVNKLSSKKSPKKSPKSRQNGSHARASTPPSHKFLNGGDLSPKPKKKEEETPTFSCSYPAQRKFASNHTPPSRYSEEEAVIANLKEVPKTEDFITYLCLRGSASVPDKLKIFSRPWTPNNRLHRKSRPHTDNGKVSKGRRYGGVVKKLVYPNRSPATSKHLSHSTSILSSSSN